ncbi:MAG TPA: hypothetical protein VGE07_02330 [Herpetosiphonaceae bacterium]
MLRLVAAEPLAELWELARGAAVERPAAADERWDIEIPQGYAALLEPEESAPAPGAERYDWLRQAYLEL